MFTSFFDTQGLDLVEDDCMVAFVHLQTLDLLSSSNQQVQSKFTNTAVCVCVCVLVVTVQNVQYMHARCSVTEGPKNILSARESIYPF